MRLFIAINFDKETVQNIIDVQKRLIELGRGNFTRSENLHLTLAFLGEVMPERIPSVKNAMKRTAVTPMMLTFDRTGFFRRDGGDIYWIGLKENRTLQVLQRELTAHLTVEGFKLESRRFEPHITLAREFCTSEEKRINLPVRPFSAHADAVSLMCSERMNRRLIYREIYRKG